MAAKYPIKIDCGSVFRRVFLWRDATGARVSLAGVAGRLLLLNRAGGTPLLELTSANGGVRVQQDVVTYGGVTSTEGTFAWEITDEQTVDITDKTGVYQFYLDFPNGDAIRIFEGSVTFSAALVP